MVKQQHSITVSARELSTILAALRLYESFKGHEELDLRFQGVTMQEERLIGSLASRDGNHLPLTGEEVEQLSLRVLNGHGTTRPRKRKSPTQKTRRRL